MAYVLVPPLPSGVRKSDYVPLEELHRERSDAVMAQVRAGDNSGSAALAAALQDAFKNNASGSGHTDTQTARGRRKTRGKQKAVGPVGPMEAIEVLDDEDEDEDEGAEARNQGSATLVHALSAAFAHNSTNPNVAPAGTSNGSTLSSRMGARAGVDNVSMSVEIVVPPPAVKRPRGRPRVVKTNLDNDRDDRTLSSSPPASHRRNEKRQPETPSRPQKKRRRVSRKGDGRGDDADMRGASGDDREIIEILGDAPQQELRRSPRRKPLSKAGPHRPKPRRTISQHRRVSMPSRVPVPSPSPTPPPQSPPATPPPPDNNNTLSGHPLTILPVPSPTGIVIAPRAFTYLPASPGGAQPRQNGSLQGFHGEEAATGAHGLLETPAAAATPMDSSLCAIPTTTATTATNTDLHHHPLDIGLDIVVPMEIGDVEQQERQDAVRTAGVPSHALRISNNSTHPDGPMLGFALSEHDDGPGPASLSADADTEASSDGFGLGLGALDVMPASVVNPYFGDGAGWIGWGVAGPSTGVVTGDEYVGDGTIDPSVLGGCGGFGASPGAGSPRKLFTARAAIDERKEKLCGGAEEDPMDREFMPSVRPVVGAGRIGAGDVRIRRKSWRKALADENEGSVRSRSRRWRKALADENEDSEDTDGAADHHHVEQCLGLDVGVARRSTSSNLSLSEASASALASASASVRLRVLMGEATFCHHCRRKTKRPKMRCTLIRESTGVQCRKLYCDLCIERRYGSFPFRGNRTL